MMYFRYMLFIVGSSYILAHYIPGSINDFQYLYCAQAVKTFAWILGLFIICDAIPKSK